MYTYIHTYPNNTTSWWQRRIDPLNCKQWQLSFVVVPLPKNAPTTQIPYRTSIMLAVFWQSTRCWCCWKSSNQRDDEKNHAKIKSPVWQMHFVNANRCTDRANSSAILYVWDVWLMVVRLTCETCPNHWRVDEKTDDFFYW